MNGTGQAVAGSRVMAAAAPRIRAASRRVSIAAFAVAAASIVLAPLVGSTRINLARALDWSIPWAANVDAQIFFVARLPRVLAAALVGAALRLVGRRLPGAAPQPAGDAVHAWRLGGRGTRRDARHHRGRCRHGACVGGGPGRQLSSARSRQSAVVYAAWPPHGIAASPPASCCSPASRSTRSSPP